MIVGGKALWPAMSAVQAYDQAMLDFLVWSLMAGAQSALLSGDTVTLPGVGRLEVRDRRRYALAHPVSGVSHLLGGEKTLVFLPDKALMKRLNGSDPIG
jgi:nucleoid DNA-binding protein